MSGAGFQEPGATITRRFPDARAVLFEAFTDPQALLQWWCPNGFRTIALDFAAVEGRPYRVELRASDGSRWVHEGHVLVVQPPERLAYTWRWTEGPLSRVETLVDISFQADGTGTTVTVSHTKFVSADEAGAHRQGWTEAFDRLHDWLAGRGHARRP